MAIQDFANEVGKFAKEGYPVSKVEDLVLKKVNTYKKITNNKDHSGGTEKYAILIAGNEDNQGTHTEGGKIASGGKQNYNQITPSIKVFSHTVKFTGLALSMLKDSARAFGNTLTTTFEKAIQDSGKECNAMAFRDGTNILGVTSTTTNSSTKVMTSGVPNHFRKGTKLYWVITTDDTTKAATTVPAVVQSVTYPTTVNGTYSVVLTANADTGSSFTTVVRGSETNTYNTGFEGLESIVGTSNTYMGLNRATAANSYWKGLQVDANSTNLSDFMLNQAYGYMELTRETVPNTIISNNTQRRMFFADTLPQLRFDDKGGRNTTPTIKTIWNDLEWVIDTDCPLNALYMLDKEYFWLLENKKLSWAETDGSILKWSNDYDAYVAYLVTYANYATNNPGAFVKLYGLNTPVVGA